MSELRIESLRLRNFKGVGNFTLTCNGDDVSVLGSNASGKTTLMDAFLWLLFDKDSQNRKDFEIKTLQESGEAKHGFDHEVEAELVIDGKPLTLKKVYREKWTKHRGSAEKQFEGHTTDYAIDGVPKKKAEYTAAIAEICDESVFRLLTDPGYFNQQMKWQDRRTLLLSVCGDVSDADVINSDKALKKLPDILGDRGAEDHRKVIAARRKAINDELERIPVRIDEVSQGLLDVSVSDRRTVEAQLAQVRADIQEKHKDRARLSDGGEAAEKKRQLAEAKARLADIEAEAKKATYGADDEKRGAINAIDFKRRKAIGETRDKESALESNQASIERLEGQMEALRKQWAEIDAESFADGMGEPDTTCAACGQDLPAERVEAAREKALASFNADKARRLEANVAEGKQLKAEAGELALRNEELRKEIVELKAKRKGLLAEKEALPEPGGQTDITYPPEREEIRILTDKLDSDIAALEIASEDALTGLDAEITAMKEQIAEGERRLAEIDQKQKGQERIKELAADEKKLAAEYEKLEKELYLLDSFTRSKVGMLEGRINSRFDLARFKLFNQLVNGSLEDCCITTYQGIPYPDLNGAAKINIGLDIIQTLQEHYEFRAPVFIDNAEAVVELLPLDSQVIRLVVSGDDKELRVETKLKEMAK